ncbi:MAG TPA: flagellar basal body P-ring protein FlgI [Planctomycetota bacterium]|nr:flagellar basal body P-ring protein FlgI [Planctomycetota bacterium]
MLHLILFAALTLPQDAPPPDPVPIYPGIGSVEAPTQPTGRSSASYRRGARFVPEPSGVTPGAIRAPIGTLVDVRGQESNDLIGVGLVSGLAGTGDSTNMVRQVLANLLLASNIRIDPQQLTAKNVALVRVEAVLPPGIQPGRRIEVRVSTLGDCKSLTGGTLTLCELTDLTGATVYATAAGPVTVGGFLAEGDGATTTKNHVTTGIIPDGAKVERAVPSRLVSEHGYIYLDARPSHASFANLVRIVEAVNQVFPAAAETATDSRTVKVRVPADIPAEHHMAYLDAILRREIEPTSFAKVVVNERSGTIVMGEGLRLRPGAIAYGSLTVTVAESPEVSQPGAFSGGTTERLSRTNLSVEEENNALAYVPGAVTLQEVVDVLNVLGTTPRELIAIVEAMAQAGLLLAEIERQ